jgi:hypothetical protein
MMEILELLAAVLAGLESLKRVYVLPPSDPPEEVPFAVLMPVSGEIMRFSMSSIRIGTVIRLWLAVGRISGEARLEEMARRAMEIRNRLFRLLAQRVGMLEGSSVWFSSPIRWDISSQTIGSADYLVLSVDLQLMEELNVDGQGPN